LGVEVPNDDVGVVHARSEVVTDDDIRGGVHGVERSSPNEGVRCSGSLRDQWSR
jgi:hypothetical protein